MSNDLIVDTKWHTCKDIFYTKETTFRGIWEKHYKSKNHCRSYYINRYRFNNIVNSIRKDMVKFMLDKVYYVKDKELEGFKDIYKTSGLNHLRMLLLMTYKTKKRFFIKHVKIKEIECKRGSTLILIFDRYFMSYIIQTFDERYSTSMFSENFSIKDFLLYKFSETQVNKQQKQKEIDRLYDICKGVLKI